jgi:hypothetical protein
MKSLLLITVSVIILSLIFGLSGVVLAEDNVGSIVAVKGKAIIDRDKKAIEAKVKDKIFMNDTVSTKEDSRAKMLFIDDSVITLGEKSKVVVKEVIYSKHQMGSTIFDLIDGKMRAIVGKTNFEVHTPTSVAAARGTIILTETGIIDGKKFVRYICYEGEFIIKSNDPNDTHTIDLTSGMMVTIFEGEPLPEKGVLAPIPEIERLWNSTDITSRNEVSIPGPVEITVDLGHFTFETLPDFKPPLGDQQPSVQGKTPVNINLIFP